MRIEIAPLTVAVALVAALGAGRAHAVDVTSCGQVVMGTGDLVADLDCSSHPGFSLQLIGRLRLNGFSIKGSPTQPVIYCNTGACRVTGMGSLWGGREGILSDVGVTVIDVRIGQQRRRRCACPAIRTRARLLEHLVQRR